MSHSTFTPGKSAIVVIGAGTGGLAVAACLRRANRDLDITVVDPASFHCYQPAWTLVGGGAYRAEDTRRVLRDCLPDGVRHVVQAVTALRPEERRVELADGSSLGYDFLVVAAGIQLNWDAIEGLPEALGRDGVTSNYRYDLTPYTWELVRGLKAGRAVFTQPAGAVKCPGAPQKALYLAADHFRRGGVPVQVEFRSAGASVFGIPFYARALDQVMASYEARTHYGQNLVQVRAAERIAVFESRVEGELVREEVHYDLLHVVPPQSAPDFIRHSTLADEAGWLAVDRHTLRHVRHANVFGLGDCTSTPNSKTAAAVKSQVPVVVGNLLQALRARDVSESYDGYAACPLTTSRGRVLLAEFVYGGAVAPSLPLDPRVPRRFYWWLKRSFLPWFYWNILIKGRGVPAVHKARRFPDETPAPIRP
jgi:sulfide:quinone oxidoreductase